ncbi:peptidylprolyl isomerase [Ramlibacter sp.]|uniref:peptidylprolyl isomerase n=1 Tax=Ramlibacter sp. TaxID=1917967 RepID=UPI00261A378F|nr:peptidylprolyl isomerase [Ramlibacter sp.]
MKTLPFTRAALATCMALATLPIGAAAATAAPVAAQAPAPASARSNAAPFAKVGETVITHQDFDAAFAQAARSKFYHGKPPQADIAKLQREVGQSLVDDLLLAREARRRKIAPDAGAVHKVIAGYDERYKDSAQWKLDRPQVVPGLVAKLERDSIIEQLATQVKAVSEPTTAQIEQYYQAHKDKFTSPEQVHLQMILLKVDPSSPQAQWDGARQEAAAIVGRLKKGASFAELAKVHSSDPSAERGGDLGYLHQGMLPEPAQQAVDRMKPGETSEPVAVLEGVAVLRLLERKLPVLNPLAGVRDRARDLYLRGKGDEAWNALLATLRRDNPVTLDESRLLPLAKADDGAAAR